MPRARAWGTSSRRPARSARRKISALIARRTYSLLVTPSALAIFSRPRRNSFGKLIVNVSLTVRHFRTSKERIKIALGAVIASPLRNRQGRALRIVAVAEPAPRRLQRHGGVPPLQEDRYRRGRDLHTGSIRLAGELPEFQ